MNIKNRSISIIFILWSTIILAQKTTYTTHLFKGQKISTVNPKNIPEDFYPKLRHEEAPTPDGKSEYSKLLKVKEQSKKLYPKRFNHFQSKRSSNVEKPILNQSFPVNHWFTGNILVGGTPNDNTLAISNNGHILASYNSTIWDYDLTADTSYLQHPSLHAFSSEFTLNDKFDPKLLYDQDADRFIIVFLNGRKSDENMIIVGFSTTNNPSDAWNLYSLSGNPLNDTTWTDYPAIALSQKELFITGNQIRDNEPWQTGFSETIIWQVDKHNGFNGDTALTSRLWTDIKYNGVNVRNLNPIQGGNELTGPNMYFLSNKNFSIQSDSIFIVEIDDDLDNTNAALTVKLSQTNVTYGAPPEANQANGHKFATNDARVLGGFLQNNQIQFVGNTVNHNNGLASIYHGIITNLAVQNPTVKGHIISDNYVEYGYANIAFSGINNTENQSIIAFNHTSDTTNAGFSAVYYNNSGEYSNVTPLVKGESYVDRITSNTDRWGDYFGIQRKYNEPGKVWTSGYYGRSDNKPATWIAEVQTPDSTIVSGFEENKNASNYQFYPNPAKTNVTIYFELLQSKKVDFSIWDINGKLVKRLYTDKAKSGKNSFSFSVLPLSNGTYILKGNFDNSENFISTKFVVNHNE